jgi:hypothetical protein
MFLNLYQLHEIDLKAHTMLIIFVFQHSLNYFDVN